MLMRGQISTMLVSPETEEFIYSFDNIGLGGAPLQSKAKYDPEQIIYLPHNFKAKYMEVFENNMVRAYSYIVDGKYKELGALFHMYTNYVAMNAPDIMRDIFYAKTVLEGYYGGIFLIDKLILVKKIKE